MSEAELKLVTDAKNCTMYTIQFLSDDDSEFEKFYAKFRNELEKRAFLGRYKEGG